MKNHVARRNVSPVDAGAELQPRVHAYYRRDARGQREAGITLEGRTAVVAGGLAACVLGAIVYALRAEKRRNLTLAAANANPQPSLQ